LAEVTPASELENPEVPAEYHYGGILVAEHSRNYESDRDQFRREAKYTPTKRGRVII
jgi:hypothetical protein